MRLFRRTLVGVSILTLLAVSAAHAAPTPRKHYTQPSLLNRLSRPGTLASISIDVNAKVNGAAGTKIGTVTADLTANPGSTMTGSFALDPAFKYLADCYDFHWVQIITSDDCPAKINGVVPSFPVVDPPAYGWDYMYQDASKRGMKDARAEDGFQSDIKEALPWYHTATEEDRDFKSGATYPINDMPSFCPPPGVTAFKTYLVAQPKGKKEFCILAGYSWSIKDAAGGNTGPTSIAVGAADATAISKALTNGNIDKWTVRESCDLDCPPPAGAKPEMHSNPTGAQAVPRDSSGAIGRIRFWLDRLSRTLTYFFDVDSLDGNETFTSIEGPADPGMAGPPIATLPPGFPKSGSWVYPDFIEPDLLAGRLYVNVHSTLFPGGEIRGQIIPGRLQSDLAEPGPACSAPDVGGTAQFPTSCPPEGYDSPPSVLLTVPGGAVEDRSNFDFFDISFRGPGGSLGGDVEQWTGGLVLTISGVGSLSDYARTLFLPVQGQTETGPVTPGAVVQSFDNDLMQLQGQITGDPDFDLLSITAGTGLGLPSPGHTTLTHLPGGNWGVDSFFDITYRIDFVGSPTGRFSGQAGSLTNTARWQAGGPTTTTAVGGSPAAFRIGSVRPNPTRAGAHLDFELPREMLVSVTVHDVAGRLLRVLAAGSFLAGRHQLDWDGRTASGNAVSPGVYFCRLNLGGHTESRTIVVVH